MTIFGSSKIGFNNFCQILRKMSNAINGLVEEFPGRTRQIEALINWFGEVRT